MPLNRPASARRRNVRAHSACHHASSSVQRRGARSGRAMHSGAGPEGAPEAQGTHGSATRSVTLGLYRPTSRTARRVPCEYHRRVRRGTGIENVGSSAAVKPARAPGCPRPRPRPASQTAPPRAGSMQAHHTSQHRCMHGARSASARTRQIHEPLWLIKGLFP